MKSGETSVLNTKIPIIAPEIHIGIYLLFVWKQHLDTPEHITLDGFREPGGNYSSKIGAHCTIGAITWARRWAFERGVIVTPNHLPLYTGENCAFWCGETLGFFEMGEVVQFCYGESFTFCCWCFLLIEHHYTLSDGKRTINNNVEIAEKVFNTSWANIAQASSGNTAINLWFRAKGEKGGRLPLTQ